MPCRSLPAAVTLCLALVTAAHAQLPSLRVTSVFPSGGQAGTSLDFSILAGGDLDGLNRLHFSHPGITAVQKTKPVEGQPEPQPVPNEFTVTIAADVAPGLYEVSGIGQFGISNPRLFYVGTATETLEVEPNDSAAQATSATLGTMVNGRLAVARDVDYVKFAGTAGQVIVLDGLAERIDSNADLAIELLDKAGTQLATSRDHHGRDPRIAYRLPADGEYIVRIHDTQYGGGPELNWRLALVAGPFVETVFPPVVTAGSEPLVQLWGYNLPGAQAAPHAPSRGALQAAPLEMLSAPLSFSGERLPTDVNPWQQPLRVQGVALDMVASQGLPHAESTGPPVVAVSPWPVVVEHEPNDSAAQGQAVAVPAEIVGQFAAPGDIDYFIFEAAKDQVLWIETWADRAGSPADPYLIVQSLTTNEKGELTVKDVQELDDTAARPEAMAAGGAHRDAAFRFVAPEAGRYGLLVRDLYGDSRGDERLVYRVAVRPETPDFRVVALAAGANFSTGTTLVGRGGTTSLLVSAFRRDGFAGPIHVTAEGLPPGVTCPETIIQSGLDYSYLVFSAAEDAADFAGPARLVARAMIGETDAVRPCEPATMGVTRDPPLARLARANCLGVGPLAPLRISSPAATLTVVQGQRIDLPIEVTRREGFAGPVAVTLIHPPKLNETAWPVAEGQASTVSPIAFGTEMPPGPYSLIFAGAAKVPSPRKDDKGNVIAVDVSERTTPINITVLPGPVVLAAEPPDKGKVKQGATIEVPVKITRRNGFAGPVTLDLLLPPGGLAGVTAAEVVVAAEADTGALRIAVAEDAAAGAPANLAVRARMDFNGQPAEVDLPLALTIEKK